MICCLLQVRHSANNDCSNSVICSSMQPGNDYQNAPATVQCLTALHSHAAASMVGTATIFPGWGHVEWGRACGTRPFLAGLGPIYLSWLIVPLLTLLSVISIFLPMRAKLFRAEDPFYSVLWVRAHIQKLAYSNANHLSVDNWMTMLWLVMQFETVLYLGQCLSLLARAVSCPACKSCSLSCCMHQVEAKCLSTSA